MATDGLILFPPLPEMPQPPVVGPDPRQDGFRRIVGALADATRESSMLSVINLGTGYHASAPALGVIKSAHEQALVHFDTRIARDRWDEDLRSWLNRSLVRWFQRAKMVTTKLYPNGIAVEIETQDDMGYYRYSFDVMLREAPGEPDSH
jgi:hypothetical protein